MQTKAEWRAWAASLPPASGAESAAVAVNVAGFLASRGWQVVLTFLAMPGEVDLDSLPHHLDLAVTRTPSVGPLTVHRLTDDLEEHPFGYRQPRADAPAIALDLIEVVLVPGVLFGLDGSRLGHGKGYYDKLLSEFVHRPYRLGVTLDRRLLDRVPMSEGDVFMDAVATESGIASAS